jgi:hypothetical protein
MDTNEVEFVSSSTDVTQSGCLGVFWFGVLLLVTLGQWCVAMGFFGEGNGNLGGQEFWQNKNPIEILLAVLGGIFLTGLGVFSVVAALANDDFLDRLMWWSMAVWALVWPFGAFGVLEWAEMSAHANTVIFVTIRLIAITIAFAIQFIQLDFPLSPDERS